MLVHQAADRCKETWPELVLVYLEDQQNELWSVLCGSLYHLSLNVLTYLKFSVSFNNKNSLSLQLFNFGPFLYEPSGSSTLVSVVLSGWQSKRK